MMKMELQMQNEDEVKKLPTVTDAPRTDGFEGGDNEDGDRVIQGALIRFTNEATWIIGDGEELSSDLELIAVKVRRVVQKWKDGAPVETIILRSGEKWPDVEMMNEAVPRKEWEEGPDGEPRGPWQAQYIVYLLDPQTMDRFTYATGTVGGGIAVRDLINKVKDKRAYHCMDNIYAVIALTDVYMATRFGGRQRPHLAVKRWITFGDGDKVLPSPDAPKLQGPQEVTPLSAKEVTKDEIPF
jgi:hypothetical protein